MKHTLFLFIALVVVLAGCHQGETFIDSKYDVSMDANWMTDENRDGVSETLNVTYTTTKTFDGRAKKVYVTVRAEYDNGTFQASHVFPELQDVGDSHTDTIQIDVGAHIIREITLRSVAHDL